MGPAVALRGGGSTRDCGRESAAEWGWNIEDPRRGCGPFIGMPGGARLLPCDMRTGGPPKSLAWDVRMEGGGRDMV